jgi:hypothetical protein
MPLYPENNQWLQGAQGAGDDWINNRTGFRTRRTLNGAVKVFRPQTDGQPTLNVQDQNLLLRGSDGEVLYFESVEQAKIYADGYAASADAIAGEIERIIPNLQRRNTARPGALQITHEVMIGHLGEPVPRHRSEFIQPLADGGSRRGFLRMMARTTGSISLPVRTLDRVDFIVVAHSEDGSSFNLWEISAEAFLALANMIPARQNNMPVRYECRFDRIQQEGLQLPPITLTQAD